MRYQSRQATCGAVAVLNALSALDHQVTEDQIVAASGLKDLTKGLGEREIKRALTALGYSYDEIHEAREPHAWLFLLDALRHGRPVVMVVDNDKHWVTAIGMLGPAVQIADPAHNDLVVGRTRARLMTRWGSEARKPWYGVVVIPPEKKEGP